MMTKDQEEVVAINRAAGLALTNRDRVIHLTDFVDSDGDRCSEADAVAAVGFDDENRWWSIDLTEFSEKETKQ